ncbi:uncharacterized protein LOC113291624 [Papaver somniferum]|uniref:uncharacterized protein LOC113291624 n=1 Tax=Papaver somniferum TaxID=3469 RepID=UPI000E702653|nr:uncharacterized protein LOC113291624 [Papaver somniferum]
MNQRSTQTMRCNSESRTYPCTICGDQSHTGPQCPLFYPTETTPDQVSILHGGMNSKFEGRPKFDPYSNTYNPGWRHKPNFSWSKGSQHGGPSSKPPPGLHRNQTQFQEPSPVDHKLTSLKESLKLLAQSVVQSNQKFDDFVIMSQRNQQNNAQAISNLETQISQLSNRLNDTENRTFPSQMTPNPKVVNQVNGSGSSKHNEHIKAVITLRSGKTLENSVEPPKDKIPAKKENGVDQTSSKDLNGPKSAKSPSEEDITERVYIPPAPFPQRLAKKSLVYEQLGLGEMKLTRITLQLDDRSVKIPRGIIEDVLVQVENFIYPVDFVILDTQHVSSQDINIPIILGRPFLATANVVIHCQTGLVEFSFGNRKISVNVFKALQAPPDPEHYESICMIDSLVENTFTTNSVSDPLEACLAHFGAYYDEDSHFKEVNALLDSAPVMNYGKWQRQPEPLPPTIDKPLQLSVKAPTLKLKSLPDTRKYVFLGNENTLPGIIASDLEPDQESRLVNVLQEHKTAIGWTIVYLKGISPADCMHHIYLEEGAKTSREMQRRLNPNMKKVVRTEVPKLLDAGIIYPISHSKWVSMSRLSQISMGL